MADCKKTCPEGFTKAFGAQVLDKINNRPRLTPAEEDKNGNGIPDDEEQIMNSSPEMNAWSNCALEDLWIFDKLIVAKKAGHLCGPRGIPVPSPGKYFVRPVINIDGMGEKARIEYILNKTLFTSIQVNSGQRYLPENT